MGITIIKKRDGSTAVYDRNRIRNAINKANLAAGEPILESQVDFILSCVEGGLYDNIEEEAIQDLIEEQLYSVDRNLFTTFHDYRKNREMARRIKSNATDQVVLGLVGINKGAGKDEKVTEVFEENANKCKTLASTQRDAIAGEVSKDLTMRVLLPERVAKAHADGVIHFHDSDYFLQPIFNCCLVNIEDMLTHGFAMNGKLIEPPNSFQVACTVVTQIIASVASNQYGGQTVYVRHLAPYVEKSRKRQRKLLSSMIADEALLDQLVETEVRKEIESGIQTIQYQINTLMTTNGQSPFVTLFMYLDPEDPYLFDTALIIEEILKQRIEGIKNEWGVYITPAFPKLIYVLDEWNSLKGGEFDWLTELAVRCTAKRMYPDYISAKMMRDNYEGNVFGCMGCRSFLSPWKDADGNYKWEGRFNQGVVSLNLPQIAIVANGDENVFWQELEDRLAICREALMCRHNALKGTLSDVSPIHFQYGAIARLQPGEVIDSLLEGGYSTISLGYIGVYEMTKLMTGESHTTGKGKKFAMRVMRRLRLAVDTWKEETGIGFGLYGTPAESLCYRFARIDKERFGNIPDVTDKGYYTNSYHVDVREPIDVFSKFAFESEFQPISSGGAISYAEIPNMQDNLEALAECVRFIYDNIQYAEFNTKSDYCHACGFEGEIEIQDGQFVCPKCGNTDRQKMSITRRVCGYLGENSFNKGKMKEIASRYVHLNPISERGYEN